MKKFFVVIFSFLLLVLPFGTVARAEDTPESNLGQFIQYLCAFRNNFVFDSASRDKLTNELEAILPVAAPLDAFRKLRYDAVESILKTNGQVRYNCRVLSSWVWWKLREKEPAVDCKELTIVLRKEDDTFSLHEAVLIPYNNGEKKEWFVCDLSFMSEFRNPAFALVKLTDYIAAFGGAFVGINVNDDEYICRDGKGCVRGRDIAAWLATEGSDKESAIEVLESQKTVKIKIVKFEDTWEYDAGIIGKLIFDSSALRAKWKQYGVEILPIG